MEALQERLGGLLRERERLQGGSAKELERNRLEIVGVQWDLCYALIAKNMRY